MTDFTGIKIMKNNEINESAINGDFLLESSFSDYEIYQLLEANGYKTTEKNKNILKEGLVSGKYAVYDELDSLLQEEFKEYLNEEPIILGEDILTEGKLLNKIRWKLALFSLRFLRETSINDFFMAYYADKNGNPTEEGKEYTYRTDKKDKIKKMRELANGMKDEDKLKICQSKAAIEAERSGVGSLVGAGVAGAGAGATGYAANQADSVSYAVDYVKTWNSKEIYRSASGIAANALYRTVTPLVSLLFGTMWVAIIVAGVSAVRGILKFHKADTLRRDEIMAELKKNKSEKTVS